MSSSVSTYQIIQYLDQRSFRHSNAGFMIIVHVLEAMIRGEAHRQNLVKAYELVAQQANISKDSVEKSIRFAIRNSKVKGMTNKEFICRAYDDLVFQEQEIPT